MRSTGTTAGHTVAHFPGNIATALSQSQLSTIGIINTAIRSEGGININGSRYSPLFTTDGKRRNNGSQFLILYSLFLPIVKRKNNRSIEPITPGQSDAKFIMISPEKSILLGCCDLERKG